MTERKSDEQNVHNGPLTILEHWEMCSVRNCRMILPSATAILEHWEMCSVRNVMTKIPSCRLVLEHREV